MRSYGSISIANKSLSKNHHVPGGDPFFLSTPSGCPVATAALLYVTKLYYATKYIETFYFVTFIAFKFISIFIHGCSGADQEAKGMHDG